MAISYHISGDLAVNIARGLTAAKSLHKFGAVPAMSQNAGGSVWDVNDTPYPWSAFDTANNLVVLAVNPADDGDTIHLYGLDENYNEIEETVTLSSAGDVTSTKVFKRVYRAFYNGETPNTGNIDVQCNNTTVMRITAGKSQTLMAIYTIPAGYTGLLMKGVASCQGSADGTVDFYVRYFGNNNFRIGHTGEVAGGSVYLYEFAVPKSIPEKSEIDVTLAIRTNNSRVTAAFDLILIPNQS